MQKVLANVKFGEGLACKVTAGDRSLFPLRRTIARHLGSYYESVRYVVPSLIAEWMALDSLPAVEIGAALGDACNRWGVPQCKKPAKTQVSLVTMRQRLCDQAKVASESVEQLVLGSKALKPLLKRLMQLVLTNYLACPTSPLVAFVDSVLTAALKQNRSFDANGDPVVLGRPAVAADRDAPTTDGGRHDVRMQTPVRGFGAKNADVEQQRAFMAATESLLWPTVDSDVDDADDADDADADDADENE
jgi:hypothetical protein